MYMTCYCNVFHAFRIQCIVHKIVLLLCNRQQKLYNALNIVNTMKVVKNVRPFQRDSLMSVHK
jgi:hypothetical protein